MSTNTKTDPDAKIKAEFEAVIGNETAKTNMVLDAFDLFRQFQVKKYEAKLFEWKFRVITVYIGLVTGLGLLAKYVADGTMAWYAALALGFLGFVIYAVISRVPEA